MSVTIFVSNRLPVTVKKAQDCRLKFEPSIGGLATGLRSLRNDNIWIGWPGAPSNELQERDKEIIEAKLQKDYSCYPVFLSNKEIECHYNGFCNKTIWPLFHYFSHLATFDSSRWNCYIKVNKLFCEKVVKIARDKKIDSFWIHDYHLMLLPQLIREQIPNSKIGFFLHIPFPSYEIFRILPWRKELIEGILGADVIGFHTYGYVKHFLEGARRIAGVENEYGELYLSNRVVKVDAFPMGIDYEKFSSALSSEKVSKEINKITEKLKGRKVIISVDRLDYTKGIPYRLQAFDLFLEKYPQYKEKVTYILVVVPSRTKVEQYKLLKKEIDELIGKINGKHATLGWTPIWYIYDSLTFHRLVALYNISQIALITPLRDGMNLVAKEFLASKKDSKGVLILSEMAGSSEELSEALIVNPYNKEEIVESIREALSIPPSEQIKKNVYMRERLKRYNVKKWAKDFMEKLLIAEKIPRKLSVKQLNDEIRNTLIENYMQAKSRLILLDYDGTLINFKKRPCLAEPDEELLKLLFNLSSDTKNEVVIVSGRDKQTLSKWLGKLNLNFVAEHGAWIREKGGKWKKVSLLPTDWKKEIISILESYRDRTPGSYIEEKDFSVVWHYRNCDPELSLVRAKELKEVLFDLTANLNIKIMEGNKVIEIRNGDIDKGKASMHWLKKKQWGFILAIGDDYTDEDIFAILPSHAYSIKVRLSPTRARFYVDKTKDVRLILKMFNCD